MEKLEKTWHPTRTHTPKSEMFISRKTTRLKLWPKCSCHNYTHKPGQVQYAAFSHGFSCVWLYKMLPLLSALLVGGTTYELNLLFI